MERKDSRGQRPRQKVESMWQSVQERQGTEGNSLLNGGRRWTQSEWLKRLTEPHPLGFAEPALEAICGPEEPGGTYSLKTRA